MTFSKPFAARLTAVSLALLLAGCAQTSQPDDVFNLTVAHINDTHSNFDPVKSSFTANGDTVYNEFGGHPRLKTMSDAYKQEAQENDDSFLFLHGGDAW